MKFKCPFFVLSTHKPMPELPNECLRGHTYFCKHHVCTMTLEQTQSSIAFSSSTTPSTSSTRHRPTMVPRVMLFPGSNARIPVYGNVM